MDSLTQAALGATIGGVVLGGRLGRKALVIERLEPVLAERGLTEAPRLVQPTPFNILLWRATIAEHDRYHEALLGVFDGDRRPELETFSRGAELEPTALDMTSGRRLDWFAGPFLRYEIDRRWLLEAPPSC